MLMNQSLLSSTLSSIFINDLLQAATRRKNLFIKAKAPRLMEVIDAQVTVIRPFQVEDYGFVMTENGVMVGKGKHPILALFYSAIL